VIVAKDIAKPVALCVDYAANRFYWIDAVRLQVSSADFNGNRRDLTLTLDSGDHKGMALSNVSTTRCTYF
jgi:hypothetical protein